MLIDHFAGSPFKVELEKDLSRKQQLLDVAIIRRGPGEMTRPLPDGLNDLAPHNLVTFKSHQEALDDWALKELTGYYVSYRKLVSGRAPLLPEDQFGLYAICARHPRDLFAQFPPDLIQAGVYDLKRGSDAFRIVVAGELPKVEQNALLHLFSAVPDRVEYGADHYQMQIADTSSIVKELFGEYQIEGLNMPYTMQDFQRYVARKYLNQLTAEERVEGLSAKDVMEQFSPDDLLSRLSTKQVEAFLKRRAGKPPSTKKKHRPD